MKKLLVLLSLGCVIAGVGKGWHLLKGGFSPLRIHPDRLEVLQGEPPPQQVREILRQPYRYLGRGRQCYAFVSQDQQFVLKLPRFDHFRVPFWQRALGGNERLAADKEKRRSFILGSIELAGKELCNETGIVYVHLGETACLDQKVALIDRLGRRYWLDLDRAAFFLQEKHELMMPMLLQHMRQGNEAEARHMVEQFLALVKRRADKGIANKDPTFLKNFGYDKGRVVQIDVGSFYWGDAEVSYQQTVEQFESWLQGAVQ